LNQGNKMPDRFSPPLSQAAFALLAGKPLLWAFRLFAQVLMDEIGHLRAAPVVVTPAFRICSARQSTKRRL